MAAAADTVPDASTPRRRAPRRRRTVASVVLLFLLVCVAAVVARAEWIAQELTRAVRAEVARRTGLELRFERVGFSWRHLAARARDVELRHPTEGTLARVDTLEIRPAYTSLFRSAVKISGISVDGGEVVLRFRRGQLVNGPRLEQQPAQAEAPELPFRDLAISDVRFRVEHDALGTLELASVDVDVTNVSRRRVLIGVLAQGGSIRGARCFNGPIPRVEARAELTDWRAVRVALARVEAPGVRVRVHDARIPLNFRERIDADVAVDGTLAALTCPVPGAPPLHGRVDVSARGWFDPSTSRFDARGRARGQHLAFSALFPDRTYLYGLGEEVDAEVAANPEEVRVLSLRARHSGGTITSPGRRPDAPIVVRLGPRPTLSGHLDAQGVELHRLVREIAITDFAKVLWTLDASIDMRGDLWRMAEPPDREHPALTFDIDADTRNFAFLKQFHQFLPQEPVIAIPRAAVTGQITVDPHHVRFQNLVGRFGRSRVDVDMVQLRTVHDDRYPDVWLANARGTDVHLEDIGQLAGFPIGGTASFTAGGGGVFADPIITGDAHLRGFQYNRLPLGDYDTRRGQPWRYRDMRVDLPVVDGRGGRTNRSTFVAHDSYLDFRRWTMTAGTRITSTDFDLADYYYMFKFEHDPVFEPFAGHTMRRCRVRALAAVEREGEPCVDPNDPRHRDPARFQVPPGVESGYIQADVRFVLGRPGDDPGGVMNVEFWGRDLYAVAYDERLSHVDTHFTYDWLIRSRGSRGARMAVDFARGRFVGGGTVEGSGTMDLGGGLHFAGRARDLAIGASDMLAGTGITGTLDGSGVIEGYPDAQRWAIDVDVRGLAAASRNFGDFTARLRAAPEGPRNPDPNGRPPRARWSMNATGLGGALAIDGAIAVPWRLQMWRDVDGVVSPDWSRDWRHAEMTGDVALTRVVDLMPLLPLRIAARVGNGAVASARARIAIERLVLGEFRDADARVVVDHLEVGAQGMRFALPSGGVFAACVRDGAAWIDPAAAQGAAACARVPSQIRGRPSLARAEAPLPAAQILGPEGTRLGISGGGTLEGRLALGLRGEFDLARLASLASGVTWARGNGVFEVAFAGDTDNPTLSGTLRLQDGVLGVAALPDPIEDIDLSIRLDGTDVVLDQARAQFGSATIDLAGGALHLRGRELDRVDIPLVVRGLAMTPLPGADIALDADAHLTWAHGDALPLFAGDVTLGRVRYTRPVRMSQDPGGNISFSSGDGAESAYDPRNDRVRIDLTVHAREPIRVANNLADAEIAIAESERPFRVLGTDQRVGVLGTLTVPRGRVFFRGTDFEIRRGRVEFDNPDRIAPNFDVTAAADIRRGTDTARNQWRVLLRAFGTPQRFSLDMTSDPPLSREDIALLLTLRMVRAELDQLGADALTQSLGLEALATITGVDRTVQQLVPIIDDFRIGTAYSPAAGRTVPQVSAGRRINDRVRVGATVNTTEQREMRATVDVRIDNRTSVQLGYDNINDQGSSQLGNLGADLRWRIEFE